MKPKKYRWSRVYESAEEELQELLNHKGIDASRHELEGYETRDFPESPVIISAWSTEGTASFMVAGQRFSMQPGDALDIPANTPFTITTTLNDFAWYQSTK
jgi:mannose-6-phosphate isomerase class I